MVLTAGTAIPTATPNRDEFILFVDNCTATISAVLKNERIRCNSSIRLWCTINIFGFYFEPNIFVFVFCGQNNIRSPSSKFGGRTSALFWTEVTEGPSPGPSIMLRRRRPISPFLPKPPMSMITSPGITTDAWPNLASLEKDWYEARLSDILIY